MGALEADARKASAREVSAREVGAREITTQADNKSMHVLSILPDLQLICKP